MKRAALTALILLGACTLPRPPKTPSTPAAPPPSPLISPLRATRTRPLLATIREGPRGDALFLDPPGLHVTLGAAESGRSYVGDALEHVRSCNDEWDREFALVANAALPFDRLVAHVGSEPFCGGVSYFDLHVRAYVLDEPVAIVARAVERAGKAEVARLDAERGAPPAALVPRPEVAGFSRVAFSYERFYGDYGATAHVDAYLRAFDAGTVALVFFYTVDPAYVADGTRVDPILDVLTSAR